MFRELRAEIHQALLSQFYLLVEFLSGKVLVKDKDSRALKLVNLNPDLFLNRIKPRDATNISKINLQV
jgi:hypothetical protein